MQGADPERAEVSAEHGPVRDRELVKAAMELAIDQTGDATRKGTDIPYVSHLLAVTAFVYEGGGDDEQVAAALLHDLAEDQGGEATLQLIGERLPGHPRVVTMVRALSDAIVDDPDHKPPWLERKATYLEHLGGEPDDVLLVSLADKLHNATSILDDYRDLGEDLWERFNRKEAKYHLWYYRRLLAAFEARLDNPLVSRLKRVLDELHELVVDQVPDLERGIAEVAEEARAAITGDPDGSAVPGGAGGRGG